MGTAGFSKVFLYSSKAVGVQILKDDNIHTYCHEKWGKDNIVGIVTVYRLDGCGFEPWWGKRFSVLHTSQGMVLTTQL
jgi:hypothetical protein